MFLFSSCLTYEPVKLQVLKPAGVKINPDVYRVVFVNHSNYKKSTFASNNNEFSTFNADSLRTVQYFAGLAEVLLNSPRFYLINKPTEYIEKASYSERFITLSWDEISKLCTDSAADAAIILENYSITYTDPIKLQYSEEYVLYGSLEMENSSIWRIAIPSEKAEADNYLLKDTLFWDASGNYEVEVLSNLPNVNDATLQSCYYAGKKYGERIAQTWETKNRYLLSCENKDFQLAVSYAKLGQWDKAIEIWKKYPYSQKRRFAAYAAYNLAIASERVDNIDAALEWASKSYLTMKDKDVEQYIKILEERKKVKDKIELQLK